MGSGLALRRNAYLNPSPLWGRAGEGVGRACEIGEVQAREHRRIPRPPTLALPHKGGGNRVEPLEELAP